MSRTEYMGKLMEALEEFDEDVRSEIISDYEEHFTDGLANGKTEEQIVAELGSIEDLVEELRDLNGTGNKEKKFSFEFDTKEAEKAINDVTKGIASLLGTIAAKLTNGAEKVSNKVVNEAGNFADSFTDGFENVSEKVVNKATEFAKDISESYKANRNDDADEDFEEVAEENGFVTNDSCSKVVISADCAEINVTKSPSDEIKIEYRNYGSANQKLAYQFVSYTKGDTFYAEAKRRPGTTNFFKSLTSPKIVLDVELPDNLDCVDLTTCSGGISVEGIDGDRLNVSDMSGGVSIENCSFDAMEVNNMSGGVSLDEISADKLNVKTVSGGIKIIAESAKEVHASSTSGSIRYEGADAAVLSLLTVSGAIKAELEDCSGFNASVSSMSGGISLSCGDAVVKGSKAGDYTLGDGSVRINASSVSGSIKIEA